jgi:dTDP-4-dehydrorhamnose reductase
LGRALVERLGARATWAGGRGALDIREAAAIGRMIRESAPDVVVNAAAYNDVDGAEALVEEAFAVNATGPAHLAQSCREAGALLVHVSTDYVFDGAKRAPYEEGDPPQPLSVYGVSKLAGELLVAASGADRLLVRTSGVFAAGGSRVKGGSFVDRILARARAGERLRVVTDQVFAPTFARDLAAALVCLIDRGARGLFHVTNSGSCTWHELASACVELAGLQVAVEPARSDQLNRPARRPPYSVLSNARYGALGLPPLRPWRDALRELVAG